MLSCFKIPATKEEGPNKSDIEGIPQGFFVVLPKGNTRQGSSRVPPNNQLCFNCNKTGHWARECPYPKKNSNQNQRQSNTNACPGFAHYTTIEEIPSGEVVAAGMFLVNHHPTIVLFDSRASHSFMSQTFASKHDQKIFVIDKGGYCISAARNNISTNQIVRDVLISISEREYIMDLVVLLVLGIDMILGMK
jgi:hypothetical protein